MHLMRRRPETHAAAPYLAVAAALAWLAWPSSGSAADALGVLSVAEPPGPSADLARITGQLREALAARVSGVVEASDLRSRMVGKPAPASLAELDRAYAGALSAHAAGEYEGAVRTLRTVVDDLERLPDGPEVFAQWTRAMLRLARTQQELGRRVEAQEVLEQLFRAKPDLKVDVRQFPPSFLSLVDEASGRLRSLGKHRLEVKAQPPATIFVDGRDVGKSPVVLDLPAGKYRLAGQREGLRVSASEVDLSQEDKSVDLDMSLVDAFRPDAGPGLALPQEAWPLQIITAAARLGLDKVVVTSTQQTGDVTLVLAALHDVRRGTLEREGRLRIVGGEPKPGGVEALASFLLNGQPSILVSTAAGPTLVLRPNDPNAPPGLMGLGEPPPGPSKAYGWVATGTGAATLVAGGLAIYFAVRSSGKYSDARSLLGSDGLPTGNHTSAQVNELIQEGDSFRSKAIGFGIGAGVMLATTAVLSYVSYKQTGEIGPIHF
jgi:hypothetical protein